MRQRDLSHKLCFVLVILIGLYCAGAVWGDISFRYVHPIIVGGQEMAAESDYTQMPETLRWSTRISSFGLLFVSLYFPYGARRIKTLQIPLLVYAVTWCWSLYLLLAKTTAPLQMVTSYAMFSNFGPGILCILGLFFLTARDELWEEVKDNIARLVVAMGVATFIFAPFVEAGSRFSGRRYLSALATTLQICAMAPIFIKPRGMPRFLRYVPLAASLLCGILIQTRLTYVLTLMQLLSVALVKRQQIFSWMVKPKLSFRQTIAMFFAAGFAMAAIGAILVGPFRESKDAFVNRLDEDTRTNQAINFFEKVPLSSLVLGHGYPTGVEYTSQGIDGIDVGFVNAAYVGGLPADLCIIYFLVLPGILLLRSRYVDEAAQVGPFCLTTGLAYFSSTVFDISPGGVIFMILLAGRAYSIAHRRSSRSPMGIAALAQEGALAR